LNPAAKQELDGILVQAMVVPEHEILLGVLRDPIFGPIIACGPGSGNVEKRNDIFFVLPSGIHDDFATLLSKQELGARIGAAGIMAVSDLMVRLSQLATDLGPSLAELDINPVALISGGTRALAVMTDVEAQFETSEHRLRQGTAQ
jgi:hypothetical protein